MIEGDKNFEVRFNDRYFQAGDHVLLKEYNRSTNVFSGAQKEFLITYVLHHHEGLVDGYVAFGLAETPKR